MKHELLYLSYSNIHIFYKMHYYAFVHYISMHTYTYMYICSSKIPTTCINSAIIQCSNIVPALPVCLTRRLTRTFLHLEAQSQSDVQVRYTFTQHVIQRSACHRMQCVTCHLFCLQQSFRRVLIYDCFKCRE